MYNIFPISFNKELFKDLNQIESKKDDLLDKLNKAIAYYNQNSGKNSILELAKLDFKSWKVVKKTLRLFFHPDK